MSQSYKPARVLASEAFIFPFYLEKMSYNLSWEQRGCYREKKSFILIFYNKKN